MIPPEIRREIEVFDEKVKKFLALEMPPEKFQRFRLQHGIYGQRQEGVHMVRIKIPLGMLTADQVECLADVAEKFAHNNCHVTTRQDIQIHYVKLPTVPEVMRRLAEVGLTTREACGNTVRNVTASPSAGVDPEEAFDVTPYAHAFAYHMLRNPICQSLPRKFKVAFDGGGVMTALPMIHDIGLVARIRKNGKKEVGQIALRGFEVYVGGGLGSHPVVSKLLYKFLPVEELILLGESIIRVFDRLGERKSRMKARMKFLIEKYGFEKLKEWVEEERRELVPLPEWNHYLREIDRWHERPPAVDPKKIPKEGKESAEFLAWKKNNVWRQKQKGYSMVELRLRTGDMTPKQMRSLALLLRRYADGKVRTIVHQNLLIRWVLDSDLPLLHEELKKIGMTNPDAQTCYDVTACPGTDTCRLGIASSMGLARVLEKRLYEEGEKIRKVAGEIRIKVSGCPNSCSQHHLANIGFYGGAIPTDGHVVPAFQLMLGGNAGRETTIAQPIVQVPSKNVPETVVRLLKHYVLNRSASDSFNKFYGKMKKEKIVSLLADLTRVPAYEERPQSYVDWEGEGEFSLQKGVIGECAGAAVSAVIPELSTADEILKQAEALQAHGDPVSASYKAYEAIVAACNALLFKRLVEPLTDLESTHEFENHFVRSGRFPEWKGFHREIQELRKKNSEDLLSQASRFLQACRRV